jgi:hypothetical protein
MVQNKTLPQDAKIENGRESASLDCESEQISLVCEPEQIDRRNVRSRSAKKTVDHSLLTGARKTCPIETLEEVDPQRLGDF